MYLCSSPPLTCCYAMAESTSVHHGTPLLQSLVTLIHLSCESAPVTMDQVSRLMATAIESVFKQFSESLVSMERRLDEKYSSFHLAPNHASSGHQMDASGGVANPLSSDPTISRVLSAIDARTRTPPPQSQPDQPYVDRSRSAPYRNSAVSVREDEVGRGKFPKISLYDGSADFNAFAVKFELIANSYCWTHQTKLMKLVESLTGKALDCYAIQKAEIHDSYDLTKHTRSLRTRLSVSTILVSGGLTLGPRIFRRITPLCEVSTANSQHKILFTCDLEIMYIPILN